MIADPLGNPLTVGVVVTVLHDGTLYLSSYDTDIRDAVGMKSTALSVDAFKGELTEIAKHGRVLVLLDACHSGATSLEGSSPAVDAAVLRREFAAANVNVLTSSGRSEASLEDAWQRVHPRTARWAERSRRRH